MAITKIYNGSSWVSLPNFKSANVYNGTSWVSARPKIQTSTGWNRALSDTKVITTGYYSYTNSDPFVPETTIYSGFFPKFNSAGSFGSINDSFSILYDDLPIVELFYYFNSIVGFSSDYIQLTIPGSTDNGWSTMAINGTSFNRTSAFFSGGVWQWSGVGSDPFGSGIGNSITVTWS